MRVGDFCRILTSTPARYVGAGVGIGVSAQDNGLIAGLAREEGGDTGLPLPTDSEVQWAADVVRVVLTSHTTALRVAVDALDQVLGDTDPSPGNEPPEFLAMRIAVRALDSIPPSPLLKGACEREEKIDALLLKYQVEPDGHGSEVDQLGRVLDRIASQKEQLHQMLGRALDRLIEVDGVMNEEGFKEAEALLEATRPIRD